MSGRMTRMSQSSRKKLEEAEKKMEARLQYFGTDKARVDFTAEVIMSMERYEKHRRDNFYAIVMPSGSGKTQLCDKYGFIDIDRLCTRSEHEFLNELRLDALNGKGSWDNHNEIWCSLMNETLDQMEFNLPTVILVQSEMLALSVGALPLAGFVLDDITYKEIYEDKKRKGNRAGAMLMAENRAQFFFSTNIVMKTKRMVKGFDMMEAKVIETLNVNEVPCACPNKFSIRYKGEGYDESVPEWVLVGDRKRVDVTELLDMYRHGAVPKPCMDYFMRDPEIPASYGFGVRDNEWSVFFAGMRASISNPKEFKVESDLGEVFPYKYQKNMTRANMTVSRLQKGMELLYDEEVYWIAKHHVGQPNNFVTAILCYWWGVGRHSKFRNFIKRALCVNFRFWGQVFKEFHNLIRVSDTFMGYSVDEDERHKLMYYDQMLGKEVEEADWKQEIEDRTWEFELPDHKSYNPDLQLWTQEQYMEDFEKGLTFAYSRLGTKWNAEIRSFADFYERRASWLTKGSTVFTELDSSMRKYTIDLVNEVGEVVEQLTSRHNKKSLFEVMDAIPLLGNNFELFNATKIVTKLDENGHKKRALLPGSLMHYLVFAYVLQFVERDEQIGSVRLNAPPDDDWVYFEQKLAAIPRLLFDWANYNLYHSTWEMERVIMKLHGTVYAPDDYKQFVCAIADSMHTMVIIDPEGNRHKAGRGLYSGWRGTTFINTVLNEVYNQTAELSFARLFGREPYRYKDGGGDDHDGGLNRPEDGYRMLAVMRKMNFKSNAIKQMVAMKSEFFRNTVTENSAHASPIRAMVTFINGKWEGSGNVPIAERVSAVLDQIAKVQRRGVDPQFCNTMAVISLSHWCKVNQDGEWLDLPGYVIHGRLDDGGFGVPDDMGMVWQLKDKVPEPKIIGEAKEVPGTLATRDWLSILCREVKELNVDVQVDEAKVIEMAKSSFEAYSKYDYTNVLKFRTEVLGKESAVAPRVNDSAWEFMIEFMEREKHDMKIGKLMRYQELIPYMSVSGKPMSRQQLAEVFDLNLNAEVLDFKGDVYYRRLIADPLAKIITEFCMEMVAQDVVPLKEAEEVFKDLCYMMFMNTEFRI